MSRQQKRKYNLTSRGFMVVKDLLETFERVNLVEEYDRDFWSDNIDVDPDGWWTFSSNVEADRQHKERSMPWLKNNNNRKQRYTGRK